MNLQGNGPAANAAIFDQCLLALRRVDLQRKRFTAVWTCDVCFVNQFHVRAIPNVELNRGIRLSCRALNFGVAQFAEMQLADPPAVRL